MLPSDMHIYKRWFTSIYKNLSHTAVKKLNIKNRGEFEKRAFYIDDIEHKQVKKVFRNGV